jgi:hypothetical protein
MDANKSQTDIGKAGNYASGSCKTGLGGTLIRRGTDS